MRRVVLIVVAIVAWGLAACGPKPAPHAPAVKVRTFEGITEYRLANGLQVLVFPDATRSTVTVNMTYFVGSRMEGAGETGLAHLLEHLTFKGTARFDDLMGALEARGADENGTTDVDRTNYYETLPASGDNLAFALDVEAERMRHARLTAADLATELTVVRSELEMGENDPTEVLLERVMSAAFTWHGYGRSVIGARSDLEHVPIERVRAFYDRHYQPDNAMLVIAGKLDPAEAIALVEARFGAIPRPARAPGETYTVEPVQDGERTVTLRRAADARELIVAYHTVAGADPDFVAIEAAADVLTRDPGGRLHAALVATGRASSVSALVQPLREPGLVAIGVEVRDEASLPDVQAALLAGIEGLADVTDAEVARYRTETLRDLSRELADSERLAIDLSEWAALGDWRLLFAYRDRVEAVTAADVQRVAATWLRASNRTLGELVPTAAADRVPVADTPDVAAIVEGLVDRGVEVGEAFDASLENLTARTTFGTLAGGIDTALLPKKTRGGTVELSLTLRFGGLDSLAGKRGLGGAAAELATRGTTAHTYAELEDEQARLQAEIDLDGGAGTLTLTISTVRDSLAAALDLAAEMLRSPTFPADQLEILRQEAIAGHREQRDDPTARAFLELERAIAPYPADDPRAVRTDDEWIAWWKQLDAADLEAYARDFWGTGTGELVVVGDFDPAAVTAAVEAKLAGWTSPAPYTRLPAKRFAAASSEIVVALADKEQATLAVGHDLALADTDPRHPAAELAAFVLGGSASSRLWQRLREHDGLSYDVGAWLEASPFESVGRLGAYAIMAPQNLPAARKAMLEELRRFAKQGVGKAELAAARRAWLEQAASALADDETLVATLAELLDEGRDLGWVARQWAAVEALTVDDVSAAARAIVTPDRLILVEAGVDSPPS